MRRKRLDRFKFVDEMYRERALEAVAKGSSVLYVRRAHIHYLRQSQYIWIRGEIIYDPYCTITARSGVGLRVIFIGKHWIRRT